MITKYDSSSTVIRGKRINLFDEVDVYYAAEMLDWEDFRENPKRKDMFIEKILGKSDRIYDTELWDERVNDCIYTSKNFGLANGLIIICVQENWLQKELFNVNPNILKHRKYSDIIVIKEEIKNSTKPFMHNLLFGINKDFNTFEKLCKLLRSKFIKDCHKHVTLIAGGDMTIGGLALAQEFSDIISQVTLYNGISTYNWNSSKYVQNCHKESVKSEYMYKKTGKFDKSLESNMETANDALYILKCGYFNRHKLNKRITSPFEYIQDHPTQKVDYYSWSKNYHQQWFKDNNIEKNENFKSIILEEDRALFNVFTTLQIHDLQKFKNKNA